MMIMVDELRCYLNSDTRWCHLTTDGNVEELTAFAEKLGLKPHWFQNGRVPHYDLTPRLRAKALRCGAKFVPVRQQAMVRLKKRRAERKACDG